MAQKEEIAQVTLYLPNVEPVEDWEANIIAEDQRSDGHVRTDNALERTRRTVQHPDSISLSEGC